MLGLDENILMVMCCGIGQFSGEYIVMVKVIGYNVDVVVVSFNKFMILLCFFGLMVGMVWDKIGFSFVDGFVGFLDRLC